jgi:hypothetical protein
MANLKKKVKKRWGRKFKDKRNWQVCNEQLVKRGEYWIDLAWVKTWDEELITMNHNKEGRPFQFPNSMIQLQALWHAKGYDYRGIEGMTRALVEKAELRAYNDYSTVNRRVNALTLNFLPPKDQHIIIGADGTSMQAKSGGEYMREKYGKKNRTWIQLIVIGDATHHEPLSVEANIIHESEPESAERQMVTLLKQGYSIDGFFGDGGLDKISLWNFCDDQEIPPIIKPDKNAVEDSDSTARNRAVTERNKNGYKKWARKNRYGFRWPATEGIYSATKRIFGEELSATSEKGLLQEAKLKFWAYQRLKRYGET